MVEFTGNAGDFLKIGVAAAARGDIKKVREILKAKPKWVRRVGSHGRTMLWEASHRGKLEMVKYLVRRKADVDACGTRYTPYFVEVSCYCIARHKNHDDVAEFLLSKGAKLNIHTAAFLSDLSAIKQFLKQNRKLLNEGHSQYLMGKKRADGLDFYLAPAPWATPLCYALRGGDVDTAEYLIKRGAKIKGNEESLFIAADEDSEKIRLLLASGADPEFAPTDIPDPDELVYLCRGDRGGNPDEVLRLLSLGLDVNFQDHKGKTALHRASRSGFVEAAGILIEKGADVDREDPKGETPLFDALRSTIKRVEKLKEVIKLLLHAGADPNHENHKGESPANVAKNLKRTESKKLAILFRR